MKSSVAFLIDYQIVSAVQSKFVISRYNLQVPTPRDVRQNEVQENKFRLMSNGKKKYN